MYQDKIDMTNSDEKSEVMNRCMNMLEAATYYQNIGKSVDAALYLRSTHSILMQLGDALENDRHFQS